LFNVDNRFVDELKNQKHPYETYLDLNQKLIDKYKKSFDNVTPDQINLDKETYDKSKNYLKELDATLDSLRPNFQDTYN
jgi:hypothetical protein